MDLEENIKISARVYSENQKKFDDLSKLELGNIRRDYIAGAKSDAAREYWKDQLKIEKTVGVIGHCGLDGLAELSIERMAHEGIVVVGGHGHIGSLADLLESIESASVRESIVRTEPILFEKMNNCEPVSPNMVDRSARPYERKYMANRNFKRRK